MAARRRHDREVIEAETRHRANLNAIHARYAVVLTTEIDLREETAKSIAEAAGFSRTHMYTFLRKTRQTDS